MNDLILEPQTVRDILNLFPRIEFILDVEDHIAIREYLSGTPTDYQQKCVFDICKTIMDTCPL
jgi:hypothetical protein